MNREQILLAYANATEDETIKEIFSSLSTVEEVKILLDVMAEEMRTSRWGIGDNSEMFELIESFFGVIGREDDGAMEKYQSVSQVYWVANTDKPVAEGVFVVWTQSFAGSHWEGRELTHDDYYVTRGAERVSFYRVDGIELNVAT